MPQDANTASQGKSQPRPRTQPNALSWPFFTTPQPIKRLFDKFPLHIYPHNELPERTAQHRDQNALYIFTSDDGAHRSSPSFNPGCLKWQAYLRFRNIPFVTVSSNNHASPSGALPFLLPAASSASPLEVPSPIPSHGIQRWTQNTIAKRKGKRKNSNLSNENLKHEQAGAEATATTEESSHADPSDMRYEAYMSLLDHRIRNAYLYSLYLTPPNFNAVAFPLYIAPTTTNTLVRLSLAHQLRAAAQGELTKQSARIDPEAIYQGSDKAFGALSELLGDEDYYFGERKPGLFDASVFAYTNVILNEGLDWKDIRMVDGLRRYSNLVEHRERIFEVYFQKEY